MNTKPKLKICRTVTDDVCKEYDIVREIVHNKFNELCSEYGTSAEEVRLYIFVFVMLSTKFSHVHSLEQILFALKQFYFEK